QTISQEYLVEIAHIEEAEITNKKQKLKTNITEEVTETIDNNDDNHDT
ncbi:13670_t:CDS:1, partial [Racocetra fulgida]